MSETETPAEKQMVTAEDAERMYAQAWPAKRQRVEAEVEAALRAIGERHNVSIAARVEILPAFLAGPAQANLPAPRGPDEPTTP
jgi:hypothetical protein